MINNIEIITNLEEPIKKLLTNKSNHDSHTIDLNKNYFIYRNGVQELTFAFKKYLFSPFIKAHDEITTGAGIYFDNDESQEKYAKEYINILKNTTLLGVWSAYETKERINFYEKNNIKLINATCEIIEPFFYFKNQKNILKNILKNKKLLIICSHAKSIEHQLPFLDKIFEPYTIFDNNTFIILKPPQTHCGNHNNIDWSDHLKKFYKELDEVKDDFDIALIAAGGYGAFIGNYIFNKLNKSSIYIGGALQLYFGIMGNRWRHYFEFDTFPNSYWLDHPLSEDIPTNTQIIEDSCYW